MKPSSTAFLAACSLLFALQASASSEPAASPVFSIAAVKPGDVLRQRDPRTDALRIGWMQSTEFSRFEGDEQIEEGIVYYTVMLEKAQDGTFRMEISYDFAAQDGTSKGIRSTSIVTGETFRAMTPEELEERAGVHAAEFAAVIHENFLKEKTGTEGRAALEEFLRPIVTDLLKSLPKDGLMIVRRWDDLAGRRN